MSGTIAAALPAWSALEDDFLEERNFLLHEIAKAFAILPYMIGQSEDESTRGQE